MPEAARDPLVHLSSEDGSHSKGGRGMRVAFAAVLSAYP